MFEFEDASEGLKLLVSWLLLSAVLPTSWWLVHHENIALQMARSIEGWLYFGSCFLLAVVQRPLLNRIVRHLRDR